MNYEKPKVIAEIGCNHKGEFDIAIELLDLAKLCGADVAKFQKRNNKELLTEEQYNAPHPNPRNSYGDTYGAHREYLEFDVEQHRGLKTHCEKIGLEYSTSVWDTTSAREMITIDPSLLKVPSACNNNFEMLKVLRDEYNGEVHLSFGMTTKEEEAKVVEFFEETDQAKDRLVIYSCTSGYPVPFEDVCLLEIKRLHETYGDRVKMIGFSGHHLGIAIDNAAYTLGAFWVERHFTKDRTWKGTDHAASLEPAGLRKLCRDLNATHKALTYKQEDILGIEQVQRDKLKYKKV
ncbi:N-acetylneuraminate synthase family protein [Flagellimonas pelagia]|uniref:N-acetylneuraminate synthase n=1 Tax=Flagellimonas pelagia TaxID=2306998 RepID=A0A3A1NH72_9FLAO|nr:N-acetylneuraminate synthase family protein [Allomuricauda maritima]RIV44615.1 N-acetylneuraminate synthase [Allomuricauda maritima]TXJ94677.1 N-acetylneuraminate synthase [Allomuricauda maritima]